MDWYIGLLVLGPVVIVSFLFRVGVIARQRIRERREKLARRRFEEERARKKEVIRIWDYPHSGWSKTQRILEKWRVIGVRRQPFPLENIVSVDLSLFDLHLDEQWMIEDDEFVLRLMGDIIHHTSEDEDWFVVYGVAAFFLDSVRFSRRPIEELLDLASSRHAEVRPRLARQISSVRQSRREKELKEALEASAKPA